MAAAAAIWAHCRDGSQCLFLIMYCGKKRVLLCLPPPIPPLLAHTCMPAYPVSSKLPSARLSSNWDTTGITTRPHAAVRLFSPHPFPIHRLPNHPTASCLNKTTNLEYQTTKLGMPHGCAVPKQQPNPLVHAHSCMPTCMHTYLYACTHECMHTHNRAWRHFAANHTPMNEVGQCADEEHWPILQQRFVLLPFGHGAGQNAMSVHQ